MAEIEVELAGQRSMGRVVVEESGHLFVEQLPDAHANWVRSNLACLIEVQFPFRDTASRGWLSQSRAHELKNSKTQAIRWIRIDGLDLLDSIKISTVESAGFQGTRPIVCSIKLSNHQILGKSGTQRSNARSNVKR